MSAYEPHELLQAASTSGASTIMPFNFDGRDVRMIVGQDGEPWFVAMEIAAILDYSETEAMTRKLDADEKQTRQIVGFGPRGITIINEPGLYSCILTSQKPEAKRFKRWVTHEVLPAIRKTGSYAMPTRTLTPAEMFLQNAQMMVDLEQRQLAQDEKIGRVEQRVEEIADTQLLTECPSNAESITTIRARINQKYGLPSRVIDQVVAQMPYSPKPAGTVLNGHESAKGSKYRIYWIRDISMIFERFVGESERTTPHRARHSFVEHEFKLAPGYGRDG